MQDVLENSRLAPSTVVWCGEGLDHYLFRNILEGVVPLGEISQDMFPPCFVFSLWESARPELGLRSSILVLAVTGLEFCVICFQAHLVLVYWNIGLTCHAYTT